MKQKWSLIENNAQVMLEFDTLRELKEYARKHGWEIKKSPTDNRCYYTESYVILPLFDE
jgi:sialic acid synthase SpsE